ARHRPRRLRRSLRPRGGRRADHERAPDLDLPRQGRLGLGPDGAPPRAAAARVPTPLPQPEEGAGHLRRRRPGARDRQPRLPAVTSMRIALVDPLSYTPPYD